MRKSVEVVGLGMLIVLYYMTWSALSGPDHLPERIPTHFDISGNPNGWGSPAILMFLPAIATGLYLLMTVLGVVRMQSYNLPVRVTTANLPFIREQTGVMVSWLKLEFVCLFTYVQRAMIQAARRGEFPFSPQMIFVFLIVVSATVGWHLVVILRGAKSREGS
jgi:uncharacterized membrane protein